MRHSQGDGDSQSAPGVTVAGEVRAELARQQHTVRSFAPLVNMSESTLSRRLSGKTPFTINELFDVATALNVTGSTFLRPLDGAAA